MARSSPSPLLDGSSFVVLLSSSDYVDCLLLSIDPPTPPNPPLLGVDRALVALFPSLFHVCCTSNNCCMIKTKHMQQEKNE